MFFVTGDLNIDVTTSAVAPPPAGKEAQAHITLSCGGQGGNVAWFLAALGQPVEVFGTLGADTAGNLYAAHLERSRVTFAGDRVPFATGMVSVVQEEGSYHMYRQRGANALADCTHLAAFVRRALASPGSILFLSTYSLLNEGAVDAVLEVLADRQHATTTVALDPSSIDAMRSIGRDDVLRVARACNFFLPNAEEACWLAGEADVQKAAVTLAQTIGRAVVVKQGQQGAMFRYGDEEYRAPGIAVDAVDVTGAGDAFAAAFLAAIGAGDDSQTALQAGVVFSATKVRLSGTQPAELRTRT